MPLKPSERRKLKKLKQYLSTKNIVRGQKDQSSSEKDKKDD